MALWAKAQQLPQESMQQIHAIYGEHFPIEVRHYLAQWIETKFWSDAIPPADNPQHEQYVSSLINQFIQEIETKASVVTEPDYFLIKLKLAEAARMFRQRYSLNPTYLFNYVRQCLATEMHIIKNLTGETLNDNFIFVTNNSGAEMIQKLEEVRTRTMEQADDIRKMEQEQEAFALQFHDCTKINVSIQNVTAQNPNQSSPELQKLQKQKQMMEQVLNQKVAILMQLRIAIGDKLKGTFMKLNAIQSQVLDEDLIRWKRDQQLAGNGAFFNNILDTIQEWCEILAELIWTNRQQIKEVDRLKQKLTLDPPGVGDSLPQLLAEITQLLSSLVTSTFIIEKQPPQVMKTNTRFTATVRLLVGGKLNVHMNLPQVKVTIISEAQANVLLRNEKLIKSGEASGEILNNTGTMEYQQATRQLSVSFRNMQLKKIKRAEKKGTESVMDEKFSLFFQSQFSVGGGELVFSVWTLSLPVVVIVHGNQEPHAWATVTWDNAFSEPGRIPFAVPDRVPWNKIAETLSLKFKANTGRALTDDNLCFLAQKAFRGTFTDNNQLLSWGQFCKEPLTDRNFTFWEWFYAVMRLTKEHLKEPWKDGAILGFIRKDQAEEMLQKCINGTFLLRYSDSELGGITIAWVSESQEVLMLQPFTCKDFTIRSLVDRIFDLQNLTHLFPDIPKEQGFGRYCAPVSDNQPRMNNGYVKPHLINVIPGINGSTAGSHVNTPQHYGMSPDPSRDTPSVHSYAGSSAPTPATYAETDTGYMDELGEYNIDLNGLVNLNDLMSN